MPIVTARTVISGIVNGELMRGTVEATLDTDQGGNSACDFSDLPRDFTPGTLGTFA